MAPAGTDGSDAKGATKQGDGDLSPSDVIPDQYDYEEEEGEDEEALVVKDLVKLDEEYAVLTSELKQELEKVKAQFAKKLNRNLDTRKAILASAPAATETAGEGGNAKDRAGQSDSAADVEVTQLDEMQKHANSLGTPKIPGFWLECFQRSDLKEFVQDVDICCLEYLENMEFLEKSGHLFADFLFKPNPFFTNRTIRKAVFLKEREYMDGEFDVLSTQCSQIHWKKGKNITQKKVQVDNKPERGRKGRGGKGNKQGSREVTVTQESFFSTFFRSLGEDVEDHRDGLLNPERYPSLADLKKLDAIACRTGADPPVADEAAPEKNDKDASGNAKNACDFRSVGELYAYEKKICEEDEEDEDDYYETLLSEALESFQLLKNSIFPRAIRYYRGEVELYADEGEEDSDDEGEYSSEGEGSNTWAKDDDE
ncbi:unnamed protein product [Amoebophrya sp. A120]|nr:unnamed protein product [Amoebophrya sp. A120]|eukprot:GSA120T00006486001.1